MYAKNGSKIEPMLWFVEPKCRLKINWNDFKQVRISFARMERELSSIKSFNRVLLHFVKLSAAFLVGPRNNRHSCLFDWLKTPYLITITIDFSCADTFFNGFSLVSELMQLIVFWKPVPIRPPNGYFAYLSSNIFDWKLTTYSRYRRRQVARTRTKTDVPVWIALTGLLQKKKRKMFKICYFSIKSKHLSKPYSQIAINA